MRSSVLGMRSVLGFVLGHIMCSYTGRKQKKIAEELPCYYFWFPEILAQLERRSLATCGPCLETVSRSE